MVSIIHGARDFKRRIGIRDDVGFRDKAMVAIVAVAWGVGFGAGWGFGEGSGV